MSERPEGPEGPASPEGLEGTKGVEGVDGDGTASRRVVIDIDLWSFVALAGAATLALVLFAINSAASEVLTGIGVGVLLGVAPS